MAESEVAIMDGAGVLGAAFDAAILPASLLAAGILIWLSCHGVAEVILARQGKSPSRAAVPSPLTRLLQIGLLAAALVAGVPHLS
jgi:hypothetical protein